MPKPADVDVFLVAIEPSADVLGAGLMTALRAMHKGNASFRGLGGAGMIQAGLASTGHVAGLANFGVGGVVARLPTILRSLRETVDAIVARPPDVLILIDAPDFTHRVAHRVRRRLPSLPVVKYVSPSVWAWRPGRARVMRAYIDHILALLPFEPEVHRRLGGPPCTYVGHPLAEQVHELRPNPEEGTRRLAPPPVLLVLPGSRGGEIERLLPAFGETVALLKDRVGPIEVVIPTVPHLMERLRQATAGWPIAPRVVVETAEKQAAFRIARAALAKSGTVTLELALAGVPTIAAYKVSWLEAVVGRRMIKVPSVILANLVLGENVVPEFLQEACTAENLAAALTPLLADSPERRRQLEAFARLDAIMQIGSSAPAARAAEIVLDVVRSAKA
jgi:lipid-A-disaccharide synthase